MAVTTFKPPISIHVNVTHDETFSIESIVSVILLEILLDLTRVIIKKRNDSKFCVDIMTKTTQLPRTKLETCLLWDTDPRINMQYETRIRKSTRHTYKKILCGSRYEDTILDNDRNISDD